MRIGICAPPQHWELVKNIGYDYAEWNFSVTAAYTKEQLDQTLAQKKALDIAIPSFNGFFPGGFVMFGKDRTAIEAYAREYSAKGFERAAMFGADVAVMGEVGLAGEVRAIPQCERRIAECQRLGFNTIMIPRENLKRLTPPEGVKLLGVDTVMQALSVLF